MASRGKKIAAAAAERLPAAGYPMKACSCCSAITLALALIAAGSFASIT